MNDKVSDERIFRLKDNEGNDHLVKRDQSIEPSIVPPDLPENNMFGFIFLDSFSAAQDREFATFIDIMSGERFRTSTNRVRLYASAE